MKVITTIRLSPAERATCQRVLDSITVAYPQYHDADKSRPEHQDLRAFTGMCKGGADLSGELLERALTVLQNQYDTCVQQSTSEYWQDEVLVRGERKAAPAGGTALFTDPLAMCDMLAETRQGQARDAGAALAIVRNALILVPVPLPDEDPDA